jgi:hypothetical protein
MNARAKSGEQNNFDNQAPAVGVCHFTLAAGVCLFCEIARRESFEQFQIVEAG